MSLSTDSWKAILVVICTVFLIVGIGITGIGIWVAIKLPSVKIISFGGKLIITYQDPIFIRTLFYVLGPIITVISFVGFWGALTEKKRMLKQYIVLLTIILVMQIVIGIYEYMINNIKHINYIKIGGVIYGIQVLCIVAATIVLYSIKKPVAYTSIPKTIVH